jgi:putative solute:sodium symporter small subunit
MAQINDQEPLSRDDLRVNFFRPRAGFMRKEVTIIWITLTAWAVMTFGMPILLALTHNDPVQTLAEVPYIFGIPAYFWFSGQFLILWFIFLCFFFNILIDWLTSSYRRRR